MWTKEFSFIIVLFTAGLVWAAGDGENPEGLVEVYSRPHYDEPYRDRRPTWSWNFSFQYESITPTSFEGLDGSSYADLFGQGITNIQGQLGPKYNTKLGSIGFEFVYGQASIRDSKLITAGLSMNKMGGGITYTMDTLLPNPYVAPYFQYQIFNLSYKETSDVNTDEGTISMATAVVAGLLIQLNWLDESAARAAYAEAGILNAYLDLFAAQYASTASDETPELASTTMGVGFRVEY